MGLLLRQILTLLHKNLLIAAVRRPISTAIRALIFPLALVLILTYAQYFLNPPQQFGVGKPTPILSLPDALERSSPARDTVAFIYDVNANDEIKNVYKSVASQVREAGKKVELGSDEGTLSKVCKSSQRGSSSCYGAVVIRSSPTYPVSKGQWNYTLRFDESLGNSFDVEHQNNDAQVYVLPLQYAMDKAIAAQTPGRDLPTIHQFPFTIKSEKQRQFDTHQNYIDGGVSFFGVVFFLAMVGVVYQSTGSMASERELGLSQLVEAMMPNTQRWQPAVIRLFSHHLAMSIIYFPSWLVIGVILAAKVFTYTNAAVIIFYHILAGLALCSSSLFGAAFFRKAQLSGIFMAIVSVILAIIPQVLSPTDQTPTTVTALSLIFPSANYVYFLTLLGRWEYFGKQASFSIEAPESHFALHGNHLWIFLCLHIIIYPIAALGVEHLLYSTTSSKRYHIKAGTASTTVQLRDFSKTYKPNIFNKIFSPKKKDVHAVRDLNLSARKGQIYMLLGPNGSGKSTTLNAIAGLSKLSGGQIELDGAGGLGITPQKNILWDDLTVKEHVAIFTRVKSTQSRSSNREFDAMMQACDINQKANAKTKTLSGGQKRKVQLAMMFAGGSAVCCVDEASSGLDPLSRRKVWDILLAQRSSRTIIMTTHFLDEADFLSDHIAILSKGKLKAEGSTAELKHQYGRGYTIDIHASGIAKHDHGNLRRRIESDGSRKLTASDVTQAASLIAAIEKDGVRDYKVYGPTLEDVFLHLTGTSLINTTALQADGPMPRQNGVSEKTAGAVVEVIEEKAVDLHEGDSISAPKQFGLLFAKRLMVFKSKWGPHLSAVIVALIGAGVSPLLIKYMREMTCSGTSRYTSSYLDSSYLTSGYLTSWKSTYSSSLVGGPESLQYSDALSDFAALYPNLYRSPRGANPVGLLQRGLRNVTTLQGFNDFVAQNNGSLTTGGFWLGDAASSPILAWSAQPSFIYNSLLVQNLLSNVLSDVPIITSYSAFNIPPEPKRYSFPGLLFVIYFSLIFCLYPAFYALYPTIERLRQARALQYSNGVRYVPMWLAYLAFDTLHVIIISAVSTGLISAGTRLWFHLPYIFLILVLYGIASTILSYIISMFAKSQLSAWALCASGQVVMCLAYFGAYLGVSTGTDIADLPGMLMKIQYSIGFFSPVANLQRALFVSLNQFLIVCGKQSSPGAPELYGTPIAYLFMQCIFLFAILLVWDSGVTLRFNIGKIRAKQRHVEDFGTTSHSQLAELRRMQNACDGLRVLHLSKKYGKTNAVDDVTFGVGKSEIFALLGPNGAGKSTAISLIRGDIKPSSALSSVHVDNLSLLAHRAKARAQLGVCPQFDATDVLSVQDHLKFYARVRGVVDSTHNVNELIRVFGLGPYRHQLASKLSGGTKRKLSLAIAMAGNPSVLLLDEPSSGLDAASKRTMWTNLSSVAAGRSILLTTHSMEEADALADRAAIMSGRILALDTCDELRRKWGDLYHVHLVMKSAPYTTEVEMKGLKFWVQSYLPGAKIDEKTYCGQLRFSVPARGEQGVQSVGQLFNILEQNREALGIEYYAIGETTLDQVFVNVVREHGGVEEGNGQHVVKRKWWLW